MNVYNGDVGLVSESLLKDLITELRLLRMEISELNEREETKAAEALREKVSESLPDQGDLLMTPISALYKNPFSTQTTNALRRSGFDVVADITCCSLRDIKRVRMIGKRGLKEITDYLESNGLQFSDESGGQAIFKEGQQVVSLVDTANFHVGDVLVVDKVYDNSYSSYFRLPSYLCRSIVPERSKTVVFSRSEITNFK